MMLLPSSTSSSERTLAQVPRPTAAACIAAVTTALCGVALGYLGGGMYGEPATRKVAGLALEAYRYNAGNRGADVELLMLGNSLLHHGVIEDDLGDLMGLPAMHVTSLTMNGAGVADLLHLVRRLGPSLASRRRVAVIQIHRWMFEMSAAEWPRGIRSIFRDKQTGAPPARGPLRWIDAAMQWVPQRRELTGEDGWIVHVVYGWLGPRFPSLIGPIPVRARELWLADEPTRRRMARGMMPVEYARETYGEGAIEMRWLGPFRTLIGELKARSFRVVLLLPPFHSEFHSAMAGIAPNAKADRQFRSLFNDPAALGVDALIDFDDPRSFGADDSFFIDYGHMHRQGASAHTRLLAEALTRTGLFRLDEPVSPVPPSTAKARIARPTPTRSAPRATELASPRPPS